MQHMAHQKWMSTEELTLINWILIMLTISYPVTKQWMLDEVEIILKLDGCEMPFTTTQPGKSWYQYFANEHKEVTARIAQGVSKPQFSPIIATFCKSPQSVTKVCNMLQ